MRGRDSQKANPRSSWAFIAIQLRGKEAHLFNVKLGHASLRTNGEAWRHRVYKAFSICSVQSEVFMIEEQKTKQRDLVLEGRQNEG